RNDSETAGPALVAAALPVRTKMPAPRMQPTPSAIRLEADSVRLSALGPWSHSACRASSEIDFRANKSVTRPLPCSDATGAGLCRLACGRYVRPGTDISVG